MFAGHSSYRSYIAAVNNALNAVTIDCQTYVDEHVDEILELTHGPVGYTGAMGRMGPAGASGTRGANGATGPTGAQGANGHTGPGGGTGAQGMQGNQGAAGFTGPQGATGPMGTATGAGATGSIGATGPTGASGNVGVQGPPGATGPSDTIAFGSANFPLDVYGAGEASNHDVRFRTTAGPGANLWINSIANNPVSYYAQGAALNIINANFESIDGLVFSNANAYLNDGGTGGYFNWDFNNFEHNASVSSTTGLLTLQFPNAPSLIEFTLTTTARAVTTPLTYTIRLRDTSASGTVLAEASMVQTVTDQSVFMHISAIVSGVTTVAPTFTVNGPFMEITDNEEYGHRYTFLPSICVYSL